KGYIGIGQNGAAPAKDFWEYDPAGDSWTQKADFGGTARAAAIAFSIGAKGYVGTGSAGGGLLNDFWEYDPSQDTWTQKEDFGGSARNYATGFSIASKGYVGQGYVGGNGSVSKDSWEFDPAATATTGISVQEKLQSVSIYPNPASDHL